MGTGEASSSPKHYRCRLPPPGAPSNPAWDSQSARDPPVTDKDAESIRGALAPGSSSRFPDTPPPPGLAVLCSADSWLWPLTRQRFCKNDAIVTTSDVLKCGTEVKPQPSSLWLTSRALVCGSRSGPEPPAPSAGPQPACLTPEPLLALHGLQPARPGAPAPPHPLWSY